MKKRDFIFRADSSFNKSIEVTSYSIRAFIAIVCLMVIIVGLPLMISTLF